MTMGFFVYNRLFSVARARVLIIDESRRLLLVQHWARGTTWSLPGGGVNKDETHVQAAQRELHEELGIDLAIGRFDHLATVRVGYEAPLFVLQVLASEIPAQSASPHEITAMEWFALDRMPPNLSDVAQQALAVFTNRY